MMSVRDGQVENLGLLYERHCSPLLNYFVRLTGQVQVSEDLVHEVFLRMLKYRHTFANGNRFKTWMYQVARNALSDFWRKRRQEARFENPDVDEQDEITSPEPSPDLKFRQNQETALLQEALAKLPLEFREVLVLSRFQDLRYEEIARILNCRVGAVKMRVHRALQELRDRFNTLIGKERYEL